MTTVHSSNDSAPGDCGDNVADDVHTVDCGDNAANDVRTGAKSFIECTVAMDTTDSHSQRC